MWHILNFYYTPTHTYTLAEKNTHKKTRKKKQQEHILALFLKVNSTHFETLMQRHFYYRPGQNDSSQSFSVRCPLCPLCPPCPFRPVSIPEAFYGPTIRAIGHPGLWCQFLSCALAVNLGWNPPSPIPTYPHTHSLATFNPTSLSCFPSPPPIPSPKDPKNGFALVFVYFTFCPKVHRVSLFLWCPC